MMTHLYSYRLNSTKDNGIFDLSNSCISINGLMLRILKNCLKEFK